MKIINLYVYSLIKKKLLKIYHFNRFGLNIILGEKSNDNIGNETYQEANGSGKTTMIEALRFLLGKSLPNAFMNRPLLFEKDIFLSLEVEADNEILFLGRMINNPDICYYKKSQNVDWNLDLWDKLNEEQYKKHIGEFVFNLRKTDGDIPTFAQIREYFMRDEKTGFGDISISSRQASQNNRVLSYLCGLPCNGEKDIAVYKKTQKEKNDLLKQIKLLSDDITELKIRQKKLKYEIGKISNVISSLDISGKIEDSIITYTEVKSKLSKTQKKIFEYENIISQYKKNIDNLDDKLKEIKLLSNLKPFYQQLLEYFPDNVNENYLEVTNFYNFMVENRGKYFKAKIETLNLQLEKLNDEKKQLKNTLEQSTKLINSKDLLADISSISDELRQKNEELGEVKYKIELYNKKKSINNEINKIKQDIITQTEKKNDEFKNYTDTIVNLQTTFDDLLRNAYGEEGIIDFEFDNRTGLNDSTGRIKINCHIEDENSHGRLYMKINIFDLSWFIVEQTSNIGFLVHDGSYCKPDKKVKFSLLQYIEGILAEKEEGQYIITANVDEFEAAAIKYFKDNKLIVAQMDRKDEHKNRFFGFKF